MRKMLEIHSICVNCGSNHGIRPEFGQAARDLGAYLAEKGIDVIFGGSDVGLMGVVAASALQNGGRVTGVVTRAIAEKVGIAHPSAIHVVDTMHERKQMMFDLSDGFIALPGGMGTLDELFEVLTWAQLGHHSKPCGVLNVAGYWDKLLEFLDHAVQQQFIKQTHRDMLLEGRSAHELIERFREYESARIGKWF